MITGYIAGGLLVIVFMLTVVVKREDKRLLKDFGNNYEEYRK